MPTHLCVDLDGTLVLCDVSRRALRRALAARPGETLAAIWASGARTAPMKRWLAEHAGESGEDIAALPRSAAVMAYVDVARSAGQRIHLATGADQAVAERVAAALGPFEDVIGSDGTINRTGPRKRDALLARFGDDFEYIGNAWADLAVWAAAARATCAHCQPHVRLAARARGIHLHRVPGA